LLLAGLVDNEATARGRMTSLLDSGAAWETFQIWIAEQGGDWSGFQQASLSSRQHYKHIEVLAPKTGKIAQLDALSIGQLACDMGAGRRSKLDQIDSWVGIECLAKLGDTVERNQPVALVVTKASDHSEHASYVNRYLSALAIR
jgi:thymidine phosphorylase